MLSGGRAELGIGAAWYEREHRGLGVPYPAAWPSASNGSRRRSRSACRCGATTTARSRARTTSWPRRSARPARSAQPRPPILIGGSGERKTLRLVARYADACNLFAAIPDEVAHKLDVLRAPLRRRGPRSGHRSTRRSCSCGDPLDDVDAFVAEMAGYARLGVTTVDLMPTGDPVAFVERVGQEIIPRLAGLEPAG